MEKRAAIYCRVSTSRQAEHDLSIPDQRLQAERYCESHGHTVADTYIELGASATTDKRPVFQRMISDACSKEHPFDVIIVHSLSRFARNAIDAGIYERKLEKCGVRVISITQEFSDDPNGKLLRQIISSVDEHQSAENAKHTSRAMIENARNGFWNGSQPPYGYRVIEAERRGDKIKKKLAVEPEEAEIVRLVFKLYLQGTGSTGPMGIKAIASHLNEKGLLNRRHQRFSLQFVHKILRRTTYVGKHYYNCHDSHTRRLKPREEWIEVATPILIDEDGFNAVQRLLERRNPKNTPPRLTNNPVLLSGIAHCDLCGGPMRLRTGKGGQYRYYTCARKADMGKTACEGKTIRMDMLDGLVLDQLCDKVLEPERLKSVVEALIARSSTNQDKLQSDLKTLKRKKRKVDDRVEALYEAVEERRLEISATLRKRQSKLEQEREQLIRLVAMKERQINQPIKQVSERKLDDFSNDLRSQLINGNPAFRKSYLRLFVDRVDVGASEVRISGSEQALMAGAAGYNDQGTEMVPTFVQEWRARQDSNLRPPD